VQFATPVRRVSISDPELAGIVVLGPTTLLRPRRASASPRPTSASYRRPPSRPHPPSTRPRSSSGTRRALRRRTPSSSPTSSTGR
jgi:hypothetical protein